MRLVDLCGGSVERSGGNVVTCTDGRCCWFAGGEGCFRNGGDLPDGATDHGSVAQRCHGWLPRGPASAI